MKTNHRLISLFVRSAALLAGLAASSAMAEDAITEAVAVHAVAHLSPTQGNTAKGTVHFISEPDGVRVIAELEGLTPGEHGFHVHEKGDCSAADGTSAGGHFNPTNQPHAGRDAKQRHVGDLGNVTVGPDGKARVEYVDTHLSLVGPNSIVGRAVIVHGGRDDLKSQPSGDAGPRVACGRIEEV